MKQDRIFNGLSQRFQKKIYSNNDPRGRIRLHIAQDDLTPYVSSRSLKVLDVGAGMGQMTHWLAEMGHDVVCLEPSAEMLQLAKDVVSTKLYRHPVTFQEQTLQDYLAPHLSNKRRFDLIICHAVFEWLADPEAMLGSLLAALKPGGILSLMFFNRTSKELRHLLGGDLRTILKGDVASDGYNGLAPISPLLPQEVLSWLDNYPVELLSWSGVRCFYDYSHPEVRRQMKLEDVLLLERQYSQQEPWRSIARYQHMLLHV